MSISQVCIKINNRKILSIDNVYPPVSSYKELEKVTKSEIHRCMLALKSKLIETEESVSDLFLDNFYSTKCNFTYEGGLVSKNIAYPLCLQSVFFILLSF